MSTEFDNNTTIHRQLVGSSPLNGSFSTKSVHRRQQKLVDKKIASHALKDIEDLIFNKELPHHVKIFKICQRLETANMANIRAEATMTHELYCIGTKAYVFLSISEHESHRTLVLEHITELLSRALPTKTRVQNAMMYLSLSGADRWYRETKTWIFD